MKRPLSHAGRHEGVSGNDHGKNHVPFPCHSRRYFQGESRLFFCAHPLMHSRDNLVTLQICQVCPLWQQPPPETYRPFTLTAPPKPRGPCAHLGEQVGWRECPSCQGSVRLKVFACGHPRHQETTLSECLQCPDHRPCPDQA